jgi:hypothetical protein
MAFASTAHRHRRGRLIAFALALPLAGSLQPAGAATMLSYISSPQSWIGLGETVSVASEDGFEFTPHRGANSQVYFWINNFQNSPDPWSSRWWGLTLMGPMEESLAPGTYDASLPFQDSSSSLVDFWGNGRGNNRSTGSFTVLEASYAEDSSVLSFAADFTQYDEGDLNRWNKGAIRYNSEAPVSLSPEPSYPDFGWMTDLNLSDPIPDAPIDLGWDLDPNLSDPSDEIIQIDDGFSPPPIVILPEPIIEEPIHVDPVIADDLGSIDASIFPTPYPIFLDDTSFYPIFLDDISSELYEPIYWYSSGSTFISIDTDFSTITLTPAPGPLPIAGAFAGWHSARRLRRRCRERLQHGGRA